MIHTLTQAIHDVGQTVSHLIDSAGYSKVPTPSAILHDTAMWWYGIFSRMM